MSSDTSLWHSRLRDSRLSFPSNTSRSREYTDDDCATTLAPLIRPLEETDCISALAEYLAYSIPLSQIDNNTQAEVVRRLLPDEPVFSYFVGRGLSFSVQASIRAPIDSTTEILPQHLKDTMQHNAIGMVAIKRAHVREVASFGGHGSVSEAVRAIVWEYSILNHPQVHKSSYVIRMFGILWESHLLNSTSSTMLPSLIMEYADEGSLDDLIDSGAYCLHYHVKESLCIDVARGLEVLHSNFIVHGDVKTENVLVFSQPNGTLVAKVADFGCAMHTVGDKSFISIKGHSPPWDAPEAYAEHILRSDLVRMDIYCYGLLVWRVMLDGRTPLDFVRKPHTSGSEGFLVLEKCSGLEERLERIRFMKFDISDTFLQQVLLTIPGHGLKESTIVKVLQSTIRTDPKNRAEDIIDVVRLFSKQFSNDMSGLHRKSKVREVSFALGSTIMTGSLPSFTHEFGYRYMDVLSGGGHPDDPTSKIRSEVRDAIRNDYLCIASDQYISDTRRARAAFEYSLRVLSASKDEFDAKEGLKWLARAAMGGVEEARAIIYRLHKAFGIPLDEGIPLQEWLLETSKAGSFTALEDLFHIDTVLYHQAVAYRESHLRFNSDDNPERHFLSKFDSDISKEEFMEIMQTSDERMPSDLKLLARNLVSIGQLESIDDKVVGISSLLHIAASIGDCSWVEALLDAGADINAQGSLLNRTAICCACLHGREDIVRLLIDRGADGSRVDLTGASLLHFLAFLQDKAAEDLIRSQPGIRNGIHSLAKPSLRKVFLCEDFAYDGNPLHWAVKLRRPKFLSALLKYGADPLQYDTYDQHIDQTAHLASGPVETGSYRDSALALAVQDHQPEMVQDMVRYLVERNCDFSRHDFLASALRTEKLRMMIINGSSYVDKLVRTIQCLHDGSLALLIGRALYYGNGTVVHYVLKNGYAVNGLLDGLTTLGRSLIYRDGSITLDLLDHGADPKMEMGNPPTTALALLALRPAGSHMLSITKRMIELGVSSATHPEGYTLLYLRAVIDGNFEVANLLAHHSDTTIDANGVILRDLLHRNNHESLTSIRYLLQSTPEARTSSLFDPDQFGRTNYHILCDVREDVRDDDLNLGILQMLLKKLQSKSILDQVDGDGRSAVTCAVQQGNHYALEELLKRGASLEVADVAPQILAVRRWAYPEILSGEFRGLSNRHRRARRSDQNSRQVMIVLLKHICQKPFISNTRARAALKSSVISLQTLNQHQDTKDDGTLHGEDTWRHVVDSMQLIDLELWDLLVIAWQKAVEISEFESSNC